MRYEKFALTTLLLSALFTFSSEVYGASVSVLPSGASSFNVQGSGMDGVAGIQLDIIYDQNSLKGPTITQGGAVSGAMLAANTTRPGYIKIAIISTTPFSGNGLIATISFASKTGNGGITSVTSSMIDKTGAKLASTTGNETSETAAAGTITNPAVPFNQPSPTVQTTQTVQTSSTAQTATTITPTYLGTVTLPTDMQQKADSQPAPTTTSPVSIEEPPRTISAEQTPTSDTPVTEIKTEETAQYVVYKGIIERFNQYKGSKKLPTIVALFDKQVAQSIKQDPPVLLTDGKSKATLTINLPARISSSPNFAVNGGKLVSFKQDKQVKGLWIVEVLPEAGFVKVTVTIIAGVDEFDYPLTVAPPLKTALTLDDKGWNRFLKEIGTAKAPLHDLNNDGVRNYMDEYIFVANYLARKDAPAIAATDKTTPAKPSSTKKPKRK